MADFCLECGIEMFGNEYTLELNIGEDQMVTFLCEGCGKMIWVDTHGKRVRFPDEEEGKHEPA